MSTLPDEVSPTTLSNCPPAQCCRRRCRR
jgi:hypothetical protein